MKKLVSIFLAIVMILAISVPVFAAEDTTLTINGEAGRKYDGYQLLDLTTSLKTGDHHTAHDGAHTSDCYNYAYTVNEKYRAILQKEVFDNGGNYLWTEGGKPATEAGITDDQILKYLSNQTSDNGDVYQTMRQVADRLYRAIKDASIAADATNLTGTNDTIAQGYWMFADVTNLTGNEANSLVMVDTKGQDALTITPKTALPTVEKKVKDIDDSEDDSITDNAWHDSADHDIGDAVPFKLTATLPSNSPNYETYKIVFHDTLSAGLTLNNGSFKVYMYDTLYKANVDTDVNDYTKDVTANFTVNTNPTDGCTFDVTCENVFAIEGVTKDTAFVVCYDATLNENAVIGSAGNPNQVYLEFSNNPYGDGTGKTGTDKVTVFTYQLIVNKVDSHNHALKGAGFTLYKKNLAGNYVAIGTELKGADMTTFTWTGLDDGDYKLEESTVPEGYNKMADVVFSISAVHSETDGNPTLTSLDAGQMGTGVVDTGSITKDIVNNTGTILPETGAMGTMWLILGGSIFVILAAVFMITRKKMSVYED